MFFLTFSGSCKVYSKKGDTRIFFSPGIGRDVIGDVSQPKFFSKYLLFILNKTGKPLPTQNDPKSIDLIRENNKWFVPWFRSRSYEINGELFFTVRYFLTPVMHMPK